VPKKMKSTDFGKFLQEKMFPHIEQTNLFAAKINFLKSFYRSDLVLKKWVNLNIGGSKPLSQGPLEVSRDSTLIIVRDNSIRIREDLTEDEIKKWADTKYIQNMKVKAGNTTDMKKKADALFEAA